MLTGYTQYEELRCAVCSQPKPSITCPPMAAPGNGTATCDNGAAYASQCTFSCDAAYVLSGPKSVTCLSSGQWSGAGTTTCTKPVLMPTDVYTRWGTPLCPRGSTRVFAGRIAGASIADAGTTPLPPTLCPLAWWVLLHCPGTPAWVASLAWVVAIPPCPRPPALIRGPALHAGSGANRLCVNVKPSPQGSASPACTYHTGKASGGTELFAGIPAASSFAECSQHVRRIYPHANGASYLISGTSCSAQVGMTGQAVNANYQTCVFARAEGGGKYQA